jgi:excisionase family DNA binding protein
VQGSGDPSRWLPPGHASPNWVARKGTNGEYRASQSAPSGRPGVTGNGNLDELLGPELITAITRLVDERVARAVAELGVPAPPSSWLTVPQAAELLGCSEDAVRMRIQRGRLTVSTQGRRRLPVPPLGCRVGPLTPHWASNDENAPDAAATAPGPAQEDRPPMHAPVSQDHPGIEAVRQPHPRRVRVAESVYLTHRSRDRPARPQQIRIHLPRRQRSAGLADRQRHQESRCQGRARRATRPDAQRRTG